MRNEMKKIVFLLICLGIFLNVVENKRRVKRKVLFTKNSKLFFRLNGKDNVIPWNQIFAHGWAFRVNWDLPETLPRRHKFFKREIQDELEDLTVIFEMAAKNSKKSNVKLLLVKANNLVEKISSFKSFINTFSCSSNDINEISVRVDLIKPMEAQYSDILKQLESMSVTEGNLPSQMEFYESQGYSCILKYLCEFIEKIRSSKACGVFCRIGNIVSNSEGTDAEFFQSIFEKCNEYIEDCPYSFRDTSYAATHDSHLD